MVMMNLSTESIYEQWGLSGSPFQTTALPPNSLGAVLLAGRDKELQSLAKQLVNVPKFPTIEGLNGIGKTSIVNVAAYMLFQQYLSEKKARYLFHAERFFNLRRAEV